MRVDTSFDRFRPFTYHLVSDCRWDNAEHTAIVMTVVFDHLSGEHPFRAAPDDVEEHGRELFARAVAGEFGSVAEFVPEPVSVNRLRANALAALYSKDAEDRLTAALSRADAPDEVKALKAEMDRVKAAEPPVVRGGRAP